MPLSPLCQVREGAGSFVATANGVDVGPGATVAIKLTDTTGVVDWFLQVIGTDELSAPPALDGVNGLTHQVTSPSTVVTLTFPSGEGHALGFRSEVTGVGGPITTTFGVYSLTTFSTRVGFVTETREGNADFGWATKLNPLIRSGGGGGGGGPDNYTLTDVVGEKIIPEGQAMLFEDDVVIADGGDLVLQGSVTATRTEDNFSILEVPQRSERVVQQHDEMLFTDDLVVDGQLTIDGQITDTSPQDGNNILTALSAIAPNTPAILGSDASQVSFLSPDQARAVLDVPSFDEMDDAIDAGGGGGGGGGNVPWGPEFTWAGTFILSVNTINRYSAVPGLTLQFPSGVQDGDEIQIKEISGLAGTAPVSVVVDTASLSVSVENIDLDGFTQIDVLTEYKTWIKYKYDASWGIWRIVGAAYQLP